VQRGDKTTNAVPRYHTPRQSCRTALPYLLVSFILKPSWKIFSVFGGLVINRNFSSAKKKRKEKRGVRFFSWPKINK
jgi:hypothetical protein